MLALLWKPSLEGNTYPSYRQGQPTPALSAHPPLIHNPSIPSLEKPFYLILPGRSSPDLPTASSKRKGGWAISLGSNPLCQPRGRWLPPSKGGREWLRWTLIPSSVQHWKGYFSLGCNMIRFL